MYSKRLNRKKKPLRETDNLCLLMDYSSLTESMVSKSYDKIAEICNDLMLQAATQGIAFQDDWPYAIHLLGLIYINDINSARYLWKSIPGVIKESLPEVGSAWRIGQCLWTRDYAGVYEAIREFNGSPIAHALVVSFADVLQQGWSVDPAAQMFTVKKQAIVTVQKLDPSKLQRLTEYVFHLEH